MLSVSYAGKNAYSAGKTTGVLRGDASGANRGYVLAHCGGGREKRKVEYPIHHNFLASKQDFKQLSVLNERVTMGSDHVIITIVFVKIQT